MNNDLLDLYYLIDAISSLPGIGKRSAKKIAYFLVEQDESYLESFIERIKKAKNNITLCSNCNNFAQTKSGLCEICDSPSRDKSKICIVSSIEDLNIIEQSNTFDGLYYVLWGEIDKKKINNLQNLKISKLLDRIKNEDLLQEVIIATNLTTNGMITADLLYKECFKTNDKLLYSRIGFGLPINSSIDYADEQTISYSLNNRTTIKNRN